jgi:hypothetical protein
MVEQLSESLGFTYSFVLPEDAATSFPGTYNGAQRDVMSNHKKPDFYAGPYFITQQRIRDLLITSPYQVINRSHHRE